MPFVRYARDRRGYETLYVMHAFDAPEGNAGNARSPRPRVLYACRTVPYAKVGRMSIDESVQRRIETAYPNLTFDWPRLLKEAAQSAPRPERPEARQERKGRGKRKEARASEPRAQIQKGSEVRPVRPVRGQVRSVQEGREGRDTPEVQEEVHESPEPLEPVTELIEWSASEPAEPEGEPTEPENIETHEVPTAPPLTVAPSWPAVEVGGMERTLILRGRFIEIASRILSRVSDPAEQRRLFREAERLNPETWRTAEEARDRMAAFEATYARLAERLRRERPV